MDDAGGARMVDPPSVAAAIEGVKDEVDEAVWYDSIERRD